MSTTNDTTTLAGSVERPVGRLTKKQLEFLEACNCFYRDGYTKDMKPNLCQIPFLFGPMQWEDWGFWSRSEAERFAQRLVDRKLVRSGKQFFYWLTDDGKAALSSNTTIQRPSGPLE
jgi:hypothetical protein